MKNTDVVASIDAAKEMPQRARGTSLVRHHSDTLAASRLRRRARFTAAILVQMSLAVLVVRPIEGQTSANPVTPSQPLTLFVKATDVPGPVGMFLSALGDRIQKPGKERTTLAGTFTDSNGPVQATLVWQAPGSIRFERANQPGNTVTYDSGTGSVLMTSPSDGNLLESLLDDSAESFFYGFHNGVAYRLLGQGFRVDDGKAIDDKGPWYDVYAASGQAKSQPGKPHRLKHFYFDSRTGLLARTRYSNGEMIVTTEFSNWIKSNGQAFPTKIVRSEGNIAVFTFAITSEASAPAVSDSAFSIR